MHIPKPDHKIKKGECVTLPATKSKIEEPVGRKTKSGSGQRAASRLSQNVDKNRPFKNYKKEFAV